jgi:hypothetical protein
MSACGNPLATEARCGTTSSARIPFSLSFTNRARYETAEIRFARMAVGFH